jgi:very-short-patch-repair endonuclease
VGHPRRADGTIVGHGSVRRGEAIPHELLGAASAVTSAGLRHTGWSDGGISWQVRRGRIQRLHRGSYLLGDAPDLLDLVHAALAVCPEGTVLGYHTAAAILGFGILDSDDIHVVVPGGARFPQRSGIRVHQTAVPVPEPALVRGIPCTPVARTAIDLARTVRRFDALPVLDAAMRAGDLDQESLAAEVTLHDGLRGVKLARALVPLADPAAECRQESQLRLVLLDAGFSGFQPQLPVLTDAGYPRYYLDLGNPVRRIGVEYDGSSHLDRARMRTDRTRHNWLTDRGWRMRYFTDHDLYSRRAHIIDTVARALHSSR